MTDRTPAAAHVVGTPHEPEVDPAHDTTGSLAHLRRDNVVAAVLHAVQAVVVLALATDFTLPVTASYLAGPPGAGRYETVTLFDSPLALGVALFLALSASFHVLVSLPRVHERYLRGLADHHNFYRWVEYALSSSVMVVLIAQLTGIADAAALIGLFGVNASMILFGWLQERYEEPGSGRWLPFVMGCVAGAVPWLAILLYVVAPGATSGAEPPTFVFAIIISLFLFFNSFAVVQGLQYARVGPWRRYVVGERTYILLSLTAKSALAWQVFGGTLAG
ncbi:heliorhodopsin HeR [Aquipuribacter sp. SD81]|uniref:heliorhodopsin HeR n=1 Tax=Aquipuribacter sp. SD81 TaxID=3127703 RepID=UPI00301959A5